MLSRPLGLPFPIPFGWFCVGVSDEVTTTPRPMYYFDRHLVAWRDEGGDPHVMDAFCPHLGAHLGHGGRVDGCTLVCPFHGWAFDLDGHNTNVPYSDRINKRARIRAYPTVDANGVTFVWFHPDETVEPSWDVPRVPAFTDEAGWSDDMRASFDLETTCQEITEQTVDSAHFRYVHDTATVPVLESYETSFPEAVMHSSQKFPTPRGVAEGRIDTHMYGPGLVVVSFSGIVKTRSIAMTTPVTTESCVVRLSFKHRTEGEGNAPPHVGRAFVDEVYKQFGEDRVIWEHKAHVVSPSLVPEDGPFMKFRKWYGQFYADKVAAGADIYPSPFWPDRVDETPSKNTASARLEAPAS